MSVVRANSLCPDHNLMLTLMCVLYILCCAHVYMCPCACRHTPSSVKENGGLDVHFQQVNTDPDEASTSQPQDKHIPVSILKCVYVVKTVFFPVYYIYVWVSGPSTPKRMRCHVIVIDGYMCALNRIYIVKLSAVADSIDYQSCECCE